MDRVLPDQVTTRFFMRSGDELLLATNVADTYSKMTNEELSALITYPVTAAYFILN